MQKPTDPTAPYDSYDESDSTEEDAHALSCRRQQSIKEKMTKYGNS